MFDVIELLDKSHDLAELVTFSLRHRNETKERDEHETEGNGFLHEPTTPFSVSILALRFLAFESEIRNTKLAFKLRQLFEVYRADDVDDRDLLQLGSQHGQPANLAAGVHHVNFDATVLFAPRVDDPAPGRIAQLRPDAFKVCIGVFPLVFKLKALHIDSLQAPAEFLYLLF